MIKRLILVLFVILISISLVSANELNDTDFTDLSNQIDLTPANHTLNLEKDYQLTNTSQKHIVIDKSITIDGKNHTITAKNTKRVFWVKADNVVIKNINFINSNSTGLAGGVISWWGNNGTLKDCTFSNNSASSSGGALLWKGDFGIIRNCSFSDNKVEYGVSTTLVDGEGYDKSGMIIQVVESEGGAVYLKGNNILIENCCFSNNIALLNGGAISIKGSSNVSVSNSRFRGNSAEYCGSAIDINAGSFTLRDSVFEANDGRDLFNNCENTVIINSTFDKDDFAQSFYDFKNIGYFEELSDKITQTPEGGVLKLDKDYEYKSSSNHGITISKQIVIDGAGHTLDGKKLSRIFNITSDNVTLKNINFVRGNALGFYGIYYGGGAIYWNGSNGNIIGCNFTDNSARGLEIDPYEESEIVHYDDNGRSWVECLERPVGASTNMGGAITWIGADGNILNSNFKNNHVDYPNCGGAIYWKGDFGKITNSTFTDNGAYNGAAIYWTGSDGEIILSKFLNEGIADNGICWLGYNGIIKNSHLLSYSGRNVISPYGNEVNADYNFWGDTLDNPNAVLKHDNVRYWIVANVSSDRNFVFENDEFTVYYDLTTLTDVFNSTSYYGEVADNSVNIGFKADKTGILSSEFKLYKITYSISQDCLSNDFYELELKINHTPEGGVLILDKDYHFTNGSNKGIIISKAITIDGAGHTLDGKKLSRMFNITSDNVVLRNINFINGNAFGRYFAVAGGGAIYWNGANGLIENCNFTNNSGSGIEDDPFDKEETFVTEDGLVMHVIRMRPRGCKINEGGAIVWNGTDGCVSNCIFNHNTVGYPNTGGAVCWRGNNGKIINSKFFNNDAWCGSAIAWIGDNGEIISSAVWNNSFFDGGIYWFGKNGSVKNSILVADGRAALRSSFEIDADYNYWGDTLNNPNHSLKPDNVNLWYLSTSDIKDFSNISIDTSFVLLKSVEKSEARISASNLVIYYKSNSKFKVQLYDKTGKPAVYEDVRFFINNHEYSAMTDSEGIATLKITVKPGKYTIFSQYGDIIVKNKITVKTVLITKNLSKKVKKSAKFRIKVLNSKGKAFKKQTVKIKFKGKIYKVKTDKKGIAVFKIPKNLKTGKYTIKTTFKGLTNSNKIIVKK